MKLRKATFILCISLFMMLFFDGIYVIASLNANPGVKAKKDEAGTDPVKIETEVREEKLPPVNLLILGLDGEEKRSDVILLLNFEPNTGDLNILSIARDSRVRAKGKNVKINALISMGGEAYIAQKVSELTGLPVHYYLTINFKGFRQIIDALGGVELYVPFNMNYDDPEQNLHIHLKKGFQKLNGKKAEQYVRYRKSNSGGGYNNGDIGRIKAQQDFLKALIEQKLKIKYLGKLNDIFFILKEHMKTNIEIGDVYYYLKSINKLDPANIKTFTTPGDSVYIGSVWYYIQDDDRMRDIIEKNFFK